jgi:hypothetical protein
MNSGKCTFVFLVRCGATSLPPHMFLDPGTLKFRGEGEEALEHEVPILFEPVGGAECFMESLGSIGDFLDFSSDDLGFPNLVSDIAAAIREAEQKPEFEAAPRPAATFEVLFEHFWWKCGDPGGLEEYDSDEHYLGMLDRSCTVVERDRDHQLSLQMRRKLEGVFNEVAKKEMLQWDITEFKKSHPRLLRTILGAMANTVR